MTPTDLIAKARELDAKATPGPFAVQDPMGPDILSIVANPDAEPFEWIHVAQIGTEAVGGDTRSFSEHEANAQLFAASRTLIPQLADALEISLAAEKCWKERADAYHAALKRLEAREQRR